MPIYVVGTRNQRVRIPSRPLVVSITGSVASAELELRAAPDQPIVRASAQNTVLPRLVNPVTVAVRPIGTRQFPPGTVVHLAIAHDMPDAVDPVQVLLDPVDVSGDTAVVFAVLTPRGPDIEVAVAAVADTALSLLASAARTSARAVVGRGAAPSEGAVVVALDSSGSMRGFYADGSVAAAADVVVGVADALGLRHVSAVFVGSQIIPVSQPAAQAPGGPAPESLAEAIRRSQPRWSAGARWSRLAVGRACAIVCTDFPTIAVQQRFPVIALSKDRPVPGGAAWLPAPRPGNDASAELLAHPPVLDRITATLVRALS
jgi:hypothetical protein